MDITEELRDDDRCQDTVHRPDEGPMEGFRVGDVRSDKRRNHTALFVVHRLVTRWYPKTRTSRLRIVGLAIDEDGVGEPRSMDANSVFMMYPYVRLSGPPVYPLEEEDK